MKPSLCLASYKCFSEKYTDIVRNSKMSGTSEHVSFNSTQIIVNIENLQAHFFIIVGAPFIFQ